ncbi:unnamed protein product [Prorocentrum cordatum]|uniref:C2 domain-containing protein n=1 Tax=Prorocentrum cordatum TaxID=2364126 RepID=A0ABN9V2Z2_9DINO|nr:unnamed protein product [Polarella glacialis]
MARDLELGQELPVSCQRLGFGLSWDEVRGQPAGGGVRRVWETSGRGGGYYNNLKALGKGLLHGSDEVSGAKKGIDEIVWADLERLAAQVELIVYVVACHSGGHLRDIRNGRFHILEDSLSNEVGQFSLERSDEEVDLVAAVKRDGNGWSIGLIQEPAQDGQHFIDILEPTIGNYVRKVIPGAPRRIKACFAMEKGGVADLPRSSELGAIKAGLGWDTAKGEIDLDVSAILLDQGGGHVDTVFFSNLEAPGIKHSGDNLTGAGTGDDEVIHVDLNALGPRVHQVFFVINIYTRGKSFAQVANPYCRVLMDSGDEFCKFRLAEAGDQQGLLMARLATARSLRRPSLRQPASHGRGSVDEHTLALTHTPRIVEEPCQLQALGMPSAGSMWKDSMPDVMKYAATKASDLQTMDAPSAARGSSCSARASTRGLRVTIVSATGLRSADWNGKSDPYCTVEFEGQPASRVKTSHQSKTLSPTWNEAFVLSGGGGGGGLRFCLYDYDMLGSHDALGECVLPAEQLSSGTFDGSLDVLFSGEGWRRGQGLRQSPGRRAARVTSNAKKRHEHE